MLTHVLIQQDLCQPVLDISQFVVSTQSACQDWCSLLACAERQMFMAILQSHDL